MSLLEVIDGTTMDLDDDDYKHKRAFSFHYTGNDALSSVTFVQHERNDSVLIREDLNPISNRGSEEVMNTSFDMSRLKCNNRVSLDKNDGESIRVVSSWDENDDGATNAILQHIPHGNTPRSSLKVQALGFDSFDAINYRSSLTGDSENIVQVPSSTDATTCTPFKNNTFRQQPTMINKSSCKHALATTARRFKAPPNQQHFRRSSPPRSHFAAASNCAATPASRSSYLTTRNMERTPTNNQTNLEFYPGFTAARVPANYYSDRLFDPHDSTPVVGNKRPPKRSLGTTTTATASSSLLETTTDTIDSTDTHESATPFQFTSFPASLPRIHNNHDSSSALIVCPGTIRKRMSFGNALNHSRDDEGTHNTSVSSIHDDNGCSDDDSTESPLVARTRLNFNSVISPLALTPKLAFDCDDDDIDDVFDCTDERIDLSRPYEQTRINSFASSVSSLTKNLSTSEDVSNQPTLGMTPSRTKSRGDVDFFRPRTPNELRIHFQLDAAQCSPIQGIPEEEGEISSKSGACSSKKPRKEIGGTSSSHLSSQCSSGSSDQSSRPLPELCAFESSEMGRSQCYNQQFDVPGGTSKKSLPVSPRLLCPPTPVRTPAWAQMGVRHGNSTTHPNQIARSNSLIATKILATCPPLHVDGLADDNWTSLLHSEFGDNKLLSPQHIQENTSIACGFSSSTIERLSNNNQEACPNISLATSFEILSTLGKGNFADVYRVRSKVDGRMYAVKRNRRRFRGRRDRDAALSEVHYMQLLQSNRGNCYANYCQYLLPFVQAWQEDGHFFCQTELCCRDTCREMMDFIRSKADSTKLSKSKLGFLSLIGSPIRIESDDNLYQLPEDVVWKVCHDISAGLAYMHEKDLVHNDIKPSNILFREHPTLGVLCKIGDFGMTRIAGSKEDGQEGDQKYMAKELLHTGVATPSVDIFSLGLTLYEMASTVLFTLPSDGPRWHDIRSGPKKLDVPPIRSLELNEMIKQMISPDAQQRPSSKSILLVEHVIKGGRSPSIFLRNYVQMIDEYDKKQEEIALQSEQTPRTSTRQICNPSLVGFPESLLTDLHSPDFIPRTQAS